MSHDEVQREISFDEIKSAIILPPFDSPIENPRQFLIIGLITDSEIVIASLKASHLTFVYPPTPSHSTHPSSSDSSHTPPYATD